ncbi:hypothetical protein MIZ03_1312 [Rhodoferax lithotrophicus]|uniref:Uncharacterized protein n=1 Tax=Rhodoferax lithotrophicus TaxID=2798804 RepID=A0ABM7MJU1_9BURK|nr:hypothetical protein MIZ03_1312 [Rhodoferax sp. MIZ03]
MPRAILTAGVMQAASYIQKMNGVMRRINLPIFMLGHETGISAH